MPSSNKYQIDSQNIATKSVKHEEDVVLPKKSNATIKTLLYLAANMFFLIVFVTNLPVLRDTIDFSVISKQVEFFHTYYQHCLIIEATILIWVSISFHANYSKKRFPSLVTLSGILYNDIVCIVFALVVYYLDLRNIYFSYQIILVIPIITIFLSSVFLLDDLFDLLKNKYIILNNAKKRKSKKLIKGELKPAEVPRELVDATASIEEHNILAANAAILAIPELNGAPTPQEVIEETIKAVTNETSNELKEEIAAETNVDELDTDELIPDELNSNEAKEDAAQEPEEHKE